MGRGTRGGCCPPVAQSRTRPKRLSSSSLDDTRASPQPPEGSRRTLSPCSAERLASSLPIRVIGLDCRGPECWRVQLSVTPGTAAHQPPPSVGVSRPGRWSGLPFPPSRDRTRVSCISCLVGGYFLANPWEKPPIHLDIRNIHIFLLYC